MERQKNHCFKGVKKAYLVGTSPPPPKILNKLIFSNYATRLDAKFHDEGRKVALIIDNCTGHTNFDKLEAIELVFLPANTTSKTQPMDQGVIRALKAFYHTNVARHQIKHIDAGSYARGCSNTQQSTVVSNLNSV